MKLNLVRLKSSKVELFYEGSDPLQRSAQDTTRSVHVPVHNRLLVVFLRRFILQDIFEVDSKDCRAIEVKLLSLAFIEDDYVLDFANQIDTF